MQSGRRKLMAFIGHRYPFYSGCGSFANKPFMQGLAGRSEEHAWAKLRNGAEVLVPLDDYVGRALYYVGELDRKVTWVCQRLLRPGDTVIDVGANLGLVTIICARLVGPSGRVVSFEPNPVMVDLLRQSIDRNGLTNIELHAVALGNEAGTLELNVPDQHAGKASLVRSFHESAHTVEIPVENASAAFEGLDAKEIRFWKIDVEGFEPQVIEGASEYLQRNPPHAVLFEINEYRSALGGNPSVKLLRELGYRIYGLPKKLVRMRAIEVDPDEAYPGLNDFVAVHEGENLPSILAALKV